MSQIKNIKKRISSLKQQMKLTYEDKNIESKDKSWLNEFYRKKLNRYVKIQNKLTETIEVNAPVIYSNRKQD